MFLRIKRFNLNLENQVRYLTEVALRSIKKLFLRHALSNAVRKTKKQENNKKTCRDI